jgi:flagellar hook assembly protein FlgD
MNKAKISIRFFEDREVRAVWNGKDESGNQAKNGQYFYRISNGTQRMFNTMILIR